MPREANSPPKGVTRKRTTRATARTTIRRSTATQVRSSSRVVRKAPTSIQASKNGNPTVRRVDFAIFFICFVVAGSAVIYGVSDKGQLNPTEIITERNERIARGESIDSDYDKSGNLVERIPVQDTNVNMGRGMGDLKQDKPKSKPAPASEETASSTESVLEGVATSTATSSESTTATSTEVKDEEV